MLRAYCRNSLFLYSFGQLTKKQANIQETVLLLFIILVPYNELHILVHVEQDKIALLVAGPPAGSPLEGKIHPFMIGHFALPYFLNQLCFLRMLLDLEWYIQVKHNLSSVVLS